VIDAFICSVALTTARFAERAIVHALELAQAGAGRRVLIVGAGRSGRSLLRELRETPGERVVGFVDDDPAIRGRRLNGVRVAGNLGSFEAALDQTRPDVVFVTIPNASPATLDALVRTCEAREIDCRFVRRELDIDPRVVLGRAQT